VQKGVWIEKGKKNQDRGERTGHKGNESVDNLVQPGPSGSKHMPGYQGCSLLRKLVEIGLRRLVRLIEPLLEKVFQLVVLSEFPLGKLGE
jgi:hypothetical protein